MIPERNVGIVNLRAHRAKHLSLVDGDIEINTADVKSANLRHEAGYHALADERIVHRIAGSGAELDGHHGLCGRARSQFEHL